MENYSKHITSWRTKDDLSIFDPNRTKELKQKKKKY